MMIVGNSTFAAFSTLLVVVVLPLTKAAIWSFKKKKTKHVNKSKKIETWKNIFNATFVLGIVNKTVCYFQTTKTCFNDGNFGYLPAKLIVWIWNYMSFSFTERIYWSLLLFQSFNQFIDTHTNPYRNFQFFKDIICFLPICLTD